MRNILINTPHMRVIKVKYLAPTNLKGSRIVLWEDDRFESGSRKDRVVLSYGENDGSTIEQALLYLKGKDFNIKGYGSSSKEYYIFVDNWATDWIDLDGYKRGL